MPPQTENPRTVDIRKLGIACALFALNAFVCRELFFTEYTQHLASIEGAYIGISRYILSHPFEWGWFPIWYAGVPFQNSYPPLLHFAVAGAAWALHLSPALAHHAVTAALYCVGPVGLFLLTYAVSKRLYLSFSSALVYSLTAPSVIVSSSVASWAGHSWSPARLQSLLVFGDGPHVASVALIPFAILGLHHALEKATPGRVFGAVVGLIAVVLTNWLGAFGLALAVFSYLIARSDEPRWKSLVARAAGIGVAAYIVASPWIPPSTIKAVQYNAQYTIGSYPLTLLHVAYAGLLIAATWLLRYVLLRFGASVVLRFAVFFSFFTGALVAGYDWGGVSLMPQPHRYHHELDMAMCVAATFLAGALVRPTTSRYKALVALGIFLFVVVQVFHYRKGAKELIQPIDMEATIEYQASQWLQSNLPDKRVFISGSIQFWLNAFADTPQLGGGFGQGVINDRIPIVHYGVPWTIGDGENTAIWLRLFGVKAVAVSGPDGRDAYKQVWRDPAKFDGVLPELWRQGGDVIYGVPQRSESLAHVILPQHEVLRPPIHNLDFEPVMQLATALEDDTLPLAAWSWLDTGRARVHCTLSPEQLLFVQVSYHPGWKAFVNGRACTIRRDGLGLMLVEPNCQGPCEILLKYDGGLEMLAARVASGATLLIGLAWFLLTARGSRAASTLRRAP